MAMAPGVRLCVAGAGLLLAVGCAPGRAWMRDESWRIDEGMKPEVFTSQTPGGEGISMGDDAPPLAPPFSPRDSIHKVYPEAYGSGRHRGHGLRARFIYHGNGLLP